MAKKETEPSVGSQEAAEKYKVLSTLVHDRKLYRKGAEISLTEKYAQPLLEVGTIEPAN